MKTTNEFEADMLATIIRNKHKPEEDPYRAYIFTVCSDTRLDDQKDVINIMNYLARECIKKNTELEIYQAKLAEFMTAKDYIELMQNTSYDMFKLSTEMMPDEDPLKRIIKQELEEDADDEADQE